MASARDGCRANTVVSVATSHVPITRSVVAAYRLSVSDNYYSCFPNATYHWSLKDLMYGLRALRVSKREKRLYLMSIISGAAKLVKGITVLLRIHMRVFSLLHTSLGNPYSSSDTGIDQEERKCKQRFYAERVVRERIGLNARR
jgi:hypothetical protein